MVSSSLPFLHARLPSWIAEASIHSHCHRQHKSHNSFIYQLAKDGISLLGGVRDLKLCLELSSRSYQCKLPALSARLVQPRHLTSHLPPPFRQPSHPLIIQTLHQFPYHSGYFRGQPKPELTRLIIDVAQRTVNAQTLSHRSMEGGIVAPGRVGRPHRYVWAAAAANEDASNWGPSQVRR